MINAIFSAKFHWHLDILIRTLSQQSPVTECDASNVESTCILYMYTILIREWDAGKVSFKVILV